MFSTMPLFCLIEQIVTAVIWKFLIVKAPFVNTVSLGISNTELSDDDPEFTGNTLYLSSLITLHLKLFITNLLTNLYLSYFSFASLACMHAAGLLFIRI